MPQVDLETLVSVCTGGSNSDSKISCETLAPIVTDPPDNNPPTRLGPGSDFPPESFFVSKEDELDWLDRNAYYERKDSQKGNQNNANANPNPNPTQNPNTGSQRVSLKPKASIIGLPKPQKTCFTEAKNRRQNCKPANARLFPKRAGSRGKTDPPLSEPASPKVSCMGRVRSKRDRNNRRPNRSKSGRSDNKPGRVKKPGFLASFRKIFRTRGCKDVSASGFHAPDTGISHDIRSRLPPDDVEEADRPPRKSVTGRRSFESGEPVIGLGGMQRFSSGRRADLLVGVDVA